MVALKRGRKMFSSIFPKVGSSFFDLNMSLGKIKDLLVRRTWSSRWTPVTFSVVYTCSVVSICKLSIFLCPLGHCLKSETTEVVGFRLGEI